jgi:hypothetical protein
MKTDMNTILQSQVWDLEAVTFNDRPVLQSNLRQLEQICRHYGFTKFLTEAKGQAKLAKTAKKLGIYSVGPSLAPHTLRGDTALSNGKMLVDNVDVCTSATPACKQSCVVYYGGNPAYLSGKQNAMLNRKKMLVDNPALFLAVLYRYVELRADWCIRKGMVLVVRLNISSDIIYEQVQCSMFNGYVQTSFSNLIASLVSKTRANIADDVPVVPYDYTKHFDRHQDVNYHKVYSVTDHDTAKAETAVSNGMPLAVVFDTPRGKPLPTEYTIGKFKLPVYDGDEHDYLPEHGRKPHIIGLRFKHQATHNKAKRDAVLSKHILSGFVKMAG